ncbi:hypothetical protein DFP72DRAFT_607301 [Ephemerocybe angulata]|uniref:Uncharacterized protein n=1 Tax=Ephemerocybe angulata TaxID=980116 RepID=A0A8H6M0N9_9AGAR|nr:hypothetical protein DFP72DRAFT_607301 [Tulosesus angulatus]
MGFSHSHFSPLSFVMAVSLIPWDFSLLDLSRDYRHAHCPAFGTRLILRRCACEAVIGHSEALDLSDIYPSTRDEDGWTHRRDGYQATRESRVPSPTSRCSQGGPRGSRSRFEGSWDSKRLSCGGNGCHYPSVLLAGRVEAPTSNDVAQFLRTPEALADKAFQSVHGVCTPYLP